MRSCLARPREMRLRIWDMLGATGSLAGGSEEDMIVSFAAGVEVSELGGGITMRLS